METIEQLAERFDNREGMRVVSYREIGLPVFGVPALCTFQELSALGPVEEFVLRCVQSGVTTVDEIERFLGVPRRVVSAQIGQSVYEGTVADGGRGDGRFSLTDRGRNKLAVASTARLTQERIIAFVDGVTRRVVSLTPTDLWFQNDLARLGIGVMPPMPKRRPRPIDIDVAGLNKIAEEVSPADKPVKRAVRIDAVVGRVSLSFARAIVLAFKSEDGRRMSIAFAVDGQLSAVHESAFRDAPERERVTALAAMFDSDRRRRDAQALRRELRRDLPGLELEPPNVHARATLSLRGRRVAEVLCDPSNVRWLRPYEHPSELERAFLEARGRIVISTPQVHESVVNQHFIDRLARCLSRGVGVTIAFGAQRHALTGGGAERARQALHALAQAFPNLRIRSRAPSAARVLLVDSTFVVVTTFNWLSHGGDGGLQMREEEGCVITHPSTVDAYHSLLCERMADPGTSDSAVEVEDE